MTKALWKKKQSELDGKILSLQQQINGHAAIKVKCDQEKVVLQKRISELVAEKEKVRRDWMKKEEGFESMLKTLRTQISEKSFQVNDLKRDMDSKCREVAYGLGIYFSYVVGSQVYGSSNKDTTRRPMGLLLEFEESSVF